MAPAPPPEPEGPRHVLPSACSPLQAGRAPLHQPPPRLPRQPSHLRDHTPPRSAASRQIGATAGFSALSSSADADIQEARRASPALPPPPTRRCTTVQPLHSDVVNQSYGVQLHSAFRGTVYEQYDAIAALLADLGVRSVRDRLTPSVSGSVAFSEAPGDDGHPDTRHDGRLSIHRHAAGCTREDGRHDAGRHRVHRGLQRAERPGTPQQLGRR